MTVDGGEVHADGLPTYLTRFIGRERELTELLRLTTRHALVTLYGVGGSGKTRLAVEAARRWRGLGRRETVWVPLVGVADDTEVSAAVATALGLSGGLGVDPTVGIRAALRGRQPLLVLDNCEHVVEGCRALLEAVAGSSVTVLATSRVVIAGPAEHAYPVPPLRSAVDAAGRADAVDLLLDRSQRTAPGLVSNGRNAAELQRVCEALGGLPLAIELAAGWLHVLSVSDLVAHVTAVGEPSGDSGEIEARHRSMATVLAAAWTVLPERERVAMSDLSVFVGGFTPAAAHAVAGADLHLLAALSERLLIQRMPTRSGHTRFQVHELIRQHALAASADADASRRRHLAHYVDQSRYVSSPTVAAPEMLADSPMVEEFDNIDAAGRWAIAQGDPDAALRMAVQFDQFWTRSRPSTRVRFARLDAALALPWSPTDPDAIRARGRALEDHGLSVMRWDPVRAGADFAECRVWFERIGDANGVAAGIRGQAAAHLIRGDVEAARDRAIEGITAAAATADPIGVAWAEIFHGVALRLLGMHDDAGRVLRQAWERSGLAENPGQQCFAGLCLADLLRVSGQPVEAIELTLSTLRCDLDQGFTPEVPDLSEGLAAIAGTLGRGELAAELVGLTAGLRQLNQEGPWLPVDRTIAAPIAAARRSLGVARWRAIAAPAAELPRAAAMARIEALGYALLPPARAAELRLTHREYEVLALVAEGLTSAEVAARLVLSERTVHAHLRAVFTKLGVRSRTAAVRAWHDQARTERTHLIVR